MRIAWLVYILETRHSFSLRWLKQPSIGRVPRWRWIYFSDVNSMLNICFIELSKIKRCTIEYQYFTCLFRGKITTFIIHRKNIISFDIIVPFLYQWTINRYNRHGNPCIYYKINNRLQFYNKSRFVKVTSSFQSCP